MKVDSDVTLVLYPNTFGIAYVLCENPKQIIDFGMKPIARRDAIKWNVKAKELLAFTQPHIVLVLDRSKDKISQRILSVLDEIESLATERKLEVKKYSREQIRHVFKEFKSKTKYEIAKTIVAWYPQLKSKMPYERKDWLAEHYQMGLFDAFSLMLTHYYYKE